MDFAQQLNLEAKDEVGNILIETGYKRNGKPQNYHLQALGYGTTKTVP